MDGKHDEAQRLMRDVEALRGGQARRTDGREAGGGNPERPEIERELEMARNERKELAAAGKEGQAREVERRIEKLELRREDLNRGPGSLDRRANPERGAEPLPPDAPRRLEHLKIAAEHLRAAGLHEAAERIAQQAAELGRRMDSRPDAGPGRYRSPEGESRRSVDDRGGPRGGDGRPSGEIEELRNGLRELDRRLERIERAMRERP